MKNRIWELRRQKNMTALVLAEKVGTTAQQIGRLEKSKRRLTTDWMVRIAAALDVPPEALITAEDTKEFNIIHFVGYVQAGKWQEACELPKDEWTPVHYPANPTLKGKKIFALGVKGDSMNKIFLPNRTTLICCAIDDYLELQPEGVQNGDFIIAQKTSSDGKYECTVKRYAKVNDNMVILSPESTDPQYQPIILTANKPCEYSIVAIVIDYQTKLKDL